jgi:hypothetical protein
MDHSFENACRASSGSKSSQLLGGSQWKQITCYGLFNSSLASRCWWRRDILFAAVAAGHSSSTFSTYLLRNKQHHIVSACIAAQAFQHHVKITTGDRSRPYGSAPVWTLPARMLR